jgi:hypothetical protein
MVALIHRIIWIILVVRSSHAALILLIGAAAVHEELLHWTATFSADHFLRDAPSGPWQNQTVAVMRGAMVYEVLIQCWHKPLPRHIFFPHFVLVQSRQHGVPLGPGHLCRTLADHSPTLITPIKAQHCHDLLHYGVVLHALAMLYLRVPHALKPHPEEPYESRVRQDVAKLFRHNGRVVFPNFVPRVALPHIKHLQWYLGDLRDITQSRCKLSHPLRIFPSVQANVFSFCYLKLIPYNSPIL